MNKKGFTLIELLVVIAIIGLLSTLAVVALNDARIKSRDAKRLSDIKQIQSALELYYSDNNTYPVTANAITLGSSTQNGLCGTGTTGFYANNAAGCTAAGTTQYMGVVPAAPTPPTGNAYVYTGSATTYGITFSLEKKTGSVDTGTRTATPAGIK